MFKKIPRKFLWIGLAVLAAAGAGSYFYFTRMPASADEEETAEMQTAVVRQGDIEVIASGTGSLIAEGSESLGFATSGEVAELLVKPGDEVLEGDLLAVQAKIDDLEMAVYEAQIDVLEAEQNLDLTIDNADVATAQAQLELAEARDALDDAEYTWTINQEGYRASDATMLAAEANLVLAELRLEKAKNEFDSKSNAPEAQRANAQVEYANALSAYESQLANLNWYNGHPSEIEQAMLDAEVALAEANLAEAERSYATVEAGPEGTELELAKLQLAKAQADAAAALSDLVGAEITAPFDGVILSVEASEGDSVNNDFMVIDDLTIPFLDIYIDETDLFLIDLDYPVEIIFDALPDNTYTGTVIQVDPELYSSGGVSMVHAVVEMEPDEQVSALPIGVGAAVDVIAGRAEDVLLAPVESLRDLGGGDYSVFVVVNGELEFRMVEVGLMDISFAEITSGLKAGETVSTGIVETE